MNTLYPFQREGVDWLKAAPNRLLADQPGLGKTIQVLTAANELGLREILVVCPAVAKAHWREHFKTWGADWMNPTIVTYDKLSRDKQLVQQLRDTSWDLMVLDECHYAKTKTANRTKAIYGPACKRTGGIAKSATNVWILSGTPSPNHAGELWTHLRALWPDRIFNKAYQPMNEYEFQNQFCDVKITTFGRQITGSRNIPELRQRLAPAIKRRLKSQVLKDLPPLVFRSLPVDLPPREKAPPMTGLPVGLTGEQTLDWIRANSVNLAAERRQTGLLKADAACDWIMDEMDSNNTRKLIVFAWHKEVLAKVFQRMAQYKPVLIDGSVDEAGRTKAIDLFQNDPTYRLFIGQIKACGVAITLTAASDVLFIEQDWTPDNNYQAACRAHRIGQNEGVLARVMYLNNSIDERVQKTLVRKQNELAEIYDRQGAIACQTKK